MSRFGLPGVRTREVGARPRVGLFGHLGSGNIGNDASLEAMLKYLSTDQPGAILDAMTLAPEVVKARYGVRAIPLRWLPPDEGQGPGRGGGAEVPGEGGRTRSELRPGSAVTTW